MNLPYTRVRLVRHGEVAAEHKGTFYGDAEVPLSEAGAAASLALAERLAARPPDAVASSPLSRALAVAEPLAAHCGLALLVEPRLVELDRGAWTHRSHEQIEAEQPGAIEAYKLDPEAGAAPRGETESQLCARVWAALDSLVGEHAGGDLVAVAHGHVIRVALRRVLGLSARESLGSFVPYHGVVELELLPDGRGRVLEMPQTVIPEALVSRGTPPADGSTPES